MQQQNTSYLLLYCHHIVFDGESFLPVATSLFSAYHALKQGVTPRLQPQSNAFSAYVNDEAAFLVSAKAEQQKVYWRQQLAAPLPSLALLSDFPRAEAQEFAGACFSQALPEALSQQIRAFAKQQHVTASTVFLAWYQWLLSVYTGQQDIIIGMPETGRRSSRYDGVVGYFITMLPIRSQVSPEQGFSDYLPTLALTLADALDHAGIPFPVLVREVAPEQLALSAPVFQVGFEFQNAFSEHQLKQFQQTFNEHAISFVSELVQAGEYELVLEVREQAGCFVLNLKYNPTLYRRDTIALMLERYQCLMQQTLENPKLMLAACELASAKERQQLSAWNDTHRVYPAQCVYELFLQQAQRTPDAIAVSFDYTRYSYEEVAEQTTQLAAFLQARSDKQPIIAVCVSRSPLMVLGLLGVMQSGAAYLPLDPDYPNERLLLMLKDSGASYVLTEQVLLSKLTQLGQGLTTLKCIALDSEWSTIQTVSAKQPWQPVADAFNRLAYVIYTSGSTGVPKGVAISHSALTNFLTAMQQQPGIQARDKLLAVTTYCFDIAGLELFLPLISGAECMICAADKLRDAELLKGELALRKPTLMQATPATWTMLFHSGWRNSEGVIALCGGEALPDWLRQQFLATHTQAWNLYGPTETTIWSCVAKIDASPINIGKPIANTQVFLLTPDQRLALLGCAGELCIAGAGLAQGYWQKPELTAEKFIQHPLLAEGTVYRTGDLARWRLDGCLEHLGRIDQQLKIRGFRVEPGEIEAVLSQHQQVKTCAVVAVEHAGSKRLVAYAVLNSGALGLMPELKAWLSQRIPEYLIPDFCIALASLPLTPNGKVDKKTLAQRELLVSAPPSSAAASDLEQRVLALWQEVLAVPGLSVHDKFFEVGGNSINAALLAQRLSAELTLAVTTTDLFKYATVQRLANALQNRAGQAVPPETMPISEKAASDYPDYYQNSLAIIGMSCRVPGADDVYAFWQNLSAGRCAAEPVTLDDLTALGLEADVFNRQGFVPLKYSLTGKELFDAEFFNISPKKNAELMDPQYRLLLE
ncbi:non-ribosomal peptide synthetase, partial [Methylocucumis oryzae]|uniref:non-ribosomal peptide synthetase n=1 Tax=Methylocucumis oryzae TaxID=1632867 RepID=UPI000AD11315